VSIERAEVKAALRAFGAGASLNIAHQRIDLLRYARSRITAQHSEQRFRVQVRVERGGRVAAGSLETLDPGTVGALATRIEDALTVVEPGAPAGTIPAPGDVTGQVAPADPQVTTAAQRCEWFRAIRDGLGDAAELGGSIRNDVIERVVANSDGLLASETITRVNVQAIADRDGRSASFRTLRPCPAEIDVAPVAGRLRGELGDFPVRDKVQGTCRVLLRPQAVLTLIATYGYNTLGAAGYAEHRTAVAGRMGEQVVSDLITLTDDGSDPAGIPSRFDSAGTPRRRTPLIERGRLVGVVSDLKHADVTGGVPTGHGVPQGWRFGADPAPSHLLLDAGPATDDELIAQLGDGLVVSRLDYLRVLHPKDTLVTGTTRDATYWVSGGRLAAWHPKVRLTFRLSDVLNAVLAVGRDRQCGELPFIESVVAPALLIDAGPFTLLAARGTPTAVSRHCGSSRARDRCRVGRAHRTRPPRRLRGGPAR
jgi:predicted Zn-dependent protease